MRVFVALGSNLGNRQLFIQQAITQLSQLPNTHLLGCGPTVETNPEGFDSPNKFLNTVIALDTTLLPAQMLEAALSIENTMGRVRTPLLSGYQDRVIDIDLIQAIDSITGEPIVMASPFLVLPHPRMAQRAFVLEPLLALQKLLA